VISRGVGVMNTEWRMWVPPCASTPAHIYAGVVLVATVWDYAVGEWMVSSHNAGLVARESEQASE
jgi:hypothetical protein